jgi:hypothetical protein
MLVVALMLVLKPPLLWLRWSPAVLKPLLPSWS